MLLVDPSEKGALPLYTGMVAEGLKAVDVRPIVLGNRRLLRPDFADGWLTLRWLPAGRWPRPSGALPPSAGQQAVRWLGCALVILVLTIALRPKVVHVQHPIHPRLDPLLLRVLWYMAPVVWTAHDVVPHDPSRNAIERARRLYSLPPVVLVHSLPAAKAIERIAGISATIIHHPVCNFASVPDRASARLQIGVNATARLAAAIGFIREYKGYDLLAETWELLGNEAPQLLIIGEIVDESEREVIRRLKAHPRVDVRLGYASDSDVIAANAAADLVLLPHKRGSDSGALHLARAVGTPVLSSDMEQLASVVLDTGAGRVLRRDPAEWARALTEDVPAHPCKVPNPADTGEEHLQAYLAATRNWRGSHDRATFIRT